MLASPYSRTITGPQEIAAGESIRREVERREMWPYVHQYGPPNSRRRDPMGVIVAPAVSTQDVILTFSVPSGFMFILTDLLIGAFTTGQIPAGNPGDYQLTIDKNTPLGASPVQASPITDWSNIPFNIGSLTHGPYRLPRAEEFSPEDDIRAKVLTNAGGGVGAPNFLCALFGGWLVPVDRKRGK